MIFLLLIIFQLKHFIADYPLQNAYMLGKFKDKGWVKPLAAHCGVHAVMTFCIALYFGLVTALLVSVLDFVLHFTMDRVKASPKLLGRFHALSKGEFMGIISARGVAADGVKLLSEGPAKEECKKQVVEIDKRIKSNTYFWWALGVDQMVHHFTDFLIIYILLNV